MRLRSNSGDERDGEMSSYTELTDSTNWLVSRSVVKMIFEMGSF